MILHPIQLKLLRISEQLNTRGMSLREMGRMVDETHPQKISHHLSQLEKKGLIRIDKRTGKIERIGSPKEQKLIRFLSIPILGVANCGEARSFADNHIEGYLKISKTLLKKSDNVFAVRASGSSMNRSSIAGKNIDDGDLVIIDSNDKEPAQNKYFLSIIDGLANIKKLHIDEKNKQWVLMSESSEKHQDIYIHPNDQYVIGGRVVQVMKKPRYDYSLNRL